MRNSVVPDGYWLWWLCKSSPVLVILLLQGIRLQSWQLHVAPLSAAKFFPTAGHEQPPAFHHRPAAESEQTCLSSLVWKNGTPTPRWLTCPPSKKSGFGYPPFLDNMYHVSHQNCHILGAPPVERTGSYFRTVGFAASHIHHGSTTGR